MEGPPGANQPQKPVQEQKGGSLLKNLKGLLPSRPAESGKGTKPGASREAGRQFTEADLERMQAEADQQAATQEQGLDALLAAMNGTTPAAESAASEDPAVLDILAQMKQAQEAGKTGK